MPFLLVYWSTGSTLDGTVKGRLRDEWCTCTYTYSFNSMLMVRSKDVHCPGKKCALLQCPVILVAANEGPVRIL
jgi:hypothetical protein